jgi:beta-glucosidase
VLAKPSKEGDDHPPAFDVHYSEGLKVGYKWYDAENKPPLFPFGFGLSYTEFSFSQIAVNTDSSGKPTSVTLHVKNSGERAGLAVAEVYLSLPANAGEPPRRLIGWQKCALQPGEDRLITITIDPRMLAVFDVSKDQWTILPGDYRVYVGDSSRHLPLETGFSVGPEQLVPQAAQ